MEIMRYGIEREDNSFVSLLIKKIQNIEIRNTVIHIEGYKIEE